MVRLYHLHSHSPAALNMHGAKEGRQQVPISLSSSRGQDREGIRRAEGHGQTHTGSIHIVP